VIRSLEDVERYTAALAGDHPQLAAEIRLQRSGLSELELARLSRALPQLPSSYTDVIRDWDVSTIAIGFFRLAPRRFEKADGLWQG
jgi:hypothetical protein